MNLSLSRRPARKADVWVHLARDENALFDPRSGAVHLLNDTALAIWDLCDGDTYPVEMIDAVCDLSGMHPDVVTEDIERVLSEFDRVGLVEWIE
ncbi:MAG TPA: HPr-rel-A system PqqD family peptide chaperone [Nitriliruptorales bacterium]|nr:HPr-rel-A system PqqD family peptide chaperone [Nitriliruptorales bacterium]